MLKSTNDLEYIQQEDEKKKKKKLESTKKKMFPNVSRKS